jgi:uncharacterized protein (TIGR01777 family)
METKTASANTRTNQTERGRVCVTGATGLLGSTLVLRLLERGYSVTVVSRNARTAAESLGLPCDYVEWEKESGALPATALAGAFGVIHLAGESVAGGRWSAERKRRILESRVLSTRAVVDALKHESARGGKPVFVCASAIGVYGDRGDEALDESSAAAPVTVNPRGAAFLAEVCRQWEAEAMRASTESGLRVACVRIGVVLSALGGALGELLPIFRSGAGGPTGSGRQWMSWIHLEDVVGAVIFALENEGAKGPLNATAPNPVTNHDFSRALGKVLCKPAILPAPALAVRAALGEMADIVLASQRVHPRRLTELGFEFRFTRIADAFEDLLGGDRQGDDVMLAHQWVPRPLDEVFAFFCDEKNLETITPPWLNFNVLGKSTPDIGQGTVIDYRLSLHGIPMKWKTLIAEWEPGRHFVDRQLKGPYSRWDHLHTFRELRGGTLLSDRVFYRLPAGSLGRLVAGGFVRGDVEKIFGYRRKFVRENFGGPS